MSSFSQLTVVGIHGMPLQQSVNPCTQVSPKLDRIGFHFPPLRPFIECYPWAEGTEKFQLKVFRPVLLGEFTSTFQGYFQEWLIQNVPQENRLVIVAYSGGGSFFYKWLEQQAPSVTNRVKLAFVIAALHRCREKSVSFESDPDKTYPYRDPPIDLELVVRNLGPGKLHVILAENDGTALRHNTEFPDKLLEGKQVRREIIQGATHLTICNHELVHAYIYERMMEVLDKSPWCQFSIKIFNF